MAKDPGNVTTPSPVGEAGQQAAVNNLSKGKSVPKELEGLKVVESKLEGGRLIVIVEGSDPEMLMSSEAKNLAYAQRFDYGMTNAGIETVAGLFVSDEEYATAKKKNRVVKLWRREFKLTPGL